MYEDRIVKDIAKSTYDEEDVFDFKSSANLAYTRLIKSMNRVENKFKFNWNGFYNNNFVVELSRYNYKSFLECCEEKGLIWRSGKKPTEENPFARFEDCYAYLSCNGDAPEHPGITKNDRITRDETIVKWDNYIGSYESR